MQRNRQRTMSGYVGRTDFAPTILPSDASAAHAGSDTVTTTLTADRECVVVGMVIGASVAVSLFTVDDIKIQGTLPLPGTGVIPAEQFAANSNWAQLPERVIGKNGTMKVDTSKTNAGAATLTIGALVIEDHDYVAKAKARAAARAS